jgi:hypothetical protein
MELLQLLLSWAFGGIKTHGALLGSSAGFPISTLET